MKKSLLLICHTAAMAVPAFAGSVRFDNPGFESGNNSGWTLHSGDWQANGSETLNNSHQSESAIMTSGGATGFQNERRTSNRSCWKQLVSLEQRSQRRQFFPRLASR